MKIAQAFPEGWLDLVLPDKPVALGLDVGTTEGQKSNPSALAISQEVSADIFVRLLLRWKTVNPEVTIQLLEHALKELKGIPNRGLAVDATSEKFFAADVERHFQGRMMVSRVVASENFEYKGAKMLHKIFCGNLLVNRFTDATLGIPREDWLEKDIRSVQRAAGSFQAEVDEAGNHADCFDAIKLSLFQLFVENEGTVDAAAVATGASAEGGAKRDFWRPDHSTDDRVMDERIPL